MNVGLLLSRQPRRVTPETPWLRAAVEAIRHLRARGATALVGSGHRAWDFVHWCCRVHNVPYAIFHGTAQERIVHEADSVMVLALRPNGHMDRLAQLAKKAGIPVEPIGPAVASLEAAGQDRVSRGASRRGTSGAEDGRTAVLPESAPPDLEGYLWHYTRAHYGPWPGQSDDEWYKELLEGRPGAEHSAADALCRILSERRIRANGTLVRGGTPVVCFSARAPASMMRERTFRPWLSRWDYEPWAIGIRKEAARAHGARPVLYAPETAFEDLCEADRWLFQKHDPPAIDWSHEEEWRILGDVDLSRLSPEDWVVYHHPP